MSLSEDLLTVKEAATLLRVNAKQVYAGIASGEIPALRIGTKTLRVHRQVIVGMIESALAVATAREAAEASK